jgi:hypothetical protein
MLNARRMRLCGAVHSVHPSIAISSNGRAISAGSAAGRRLASNGERQSIANGNRAIATPSLSRSSANAMRSRQGSGT